MKYLESEPKYTLSHGSVTLHLGWDPRVRKIVHTIIWAHKCRQPSDGGQTKPNGGVHRCDPSCPTNVGPTKARRTPPSRHSLTATGEARGGIHEERDSMVMNIRRNSLGGFRAQKFTAAFKLGARMLCARSWGLSRWSLVS